jgi:hypothetical protein
MTNQLRIITLGLALLLLTGCMRTFGSFEPQSQAVTESALELSLQYLDGEHVGPLYTVSLELPADWVSRFAVNNNGNVANFDFTETPGGQASIFSISALSERQYWEQAGSYPGTYRNIWTTGDTIFVYHLPRDPYFSGLTKETFTTFAEQVPSIVTTFTAELTQ